MKKTAIFINNFAGGGAEKAASNLLNELSKDNYIYLIFITSTIVYPIPQNCKVFILTKKNNLNRVIKLFLIPYFAIKLLTIIKNNNIEVLLSFMNFPNWIACFLRVLYWKGKIYISEQAAPLEEYDRNTLSGKLGLFLIKKLYPYADEIISCSQGIKHQFEQIFGSKVKLEVIYNPININDSTLKIKNTQAIDFERFTFINVAGFRPQKNHNLLLESFAKMEYKECDLILVGNEYELGNYLKGKCLELKIEKRVKFVGFEKNPFIYLKHANCFVLSSNYEGLPNVLLEAMLCDLPIISTDCPTGPREILAPNTNIFKNISTGIEVCDFGILTPLNKSKELASAMDLILKDNLLRANIKAKVKLRALNFDLKKIKIQYEAVLNQ